MAPAPLFRDPIHDGAADPTIIWNRQERTWWIVYTNRRANLDIPRFGWLHGTDIGIARSGDGGKTWRYAGIWEGLEFERGRNTFWAPEVLWHEDRYHAYVSYVPGVPLDWNERRSIVHYTSDNLRDWRFVSVLTLSSEKVIDAAVHRLPDGRWRMWYKDEAHGSYTYCADSDDLYAWRVVGPVATDTAQEGANVFFWKGRYWLLGDCWQGMRVYRSDDARNWTRQADNLLQIPGKRPDDGAIGRHGDVLVQGDRAFLFYFTHPGGDVHEPAENDVIPYALRRTSLQVAELSCAGDTLTCDRDAAVDFFLEDPAE